MRKNNTLFLLFAFCLFINTSAKGQTVQMLEQIGHLLDDAIFYSDRYITPATDVAVYQASSNWVTTPKKKKLWETSLSFHTNAFFVPKSDRKFTINNSDFSFFTIENASTAIVPTALGNNTQVWLVGQLDDGQNQTQVRVKAANGINQETVIYPYLQASLGLWHGTELVAKYSTNVKLKKCHYQVYGIGLKHNFSQYFKKIEAKNIYFSGLISYSKEDITFNFLDAQTDYGNLGLNEITGLVDTWQFQINASKQWKRFELMSALISNTSDFKYEVGGPKGQIEDLIPFQSLVNKKLEEIYKTKTNWIGELSGRYQISKIYVQTSVAFGKFVNSNFSIQYEF